MEANRMVLTASERETLRAMCAAISPTRSLPFVDLIEVGLDETPGHLRTQFRLLLRLLGSPVVNLVLSGRPKTLAAMDDTDAQAHLRALGLSRIGMNRSAFHALKALVGFLSYAAHAPGEPNPLWRETGYPGPVGPSDGRVPEPPLKRLSPLPITAATRLDADVCVIGSGAGGSVVAALLAQRAHGVLLIEGGPYRDSADFTGDEYDTVRQVSVGKGLYATEDNAFGLLAGMGLGGTTVLNWCTSLEPPADVLEEWEREHGIDGLIGPEFRAVLDLVKARVNVNTSQSRHNANNQVLVDGAATLGYQVETLPRNVDGCGDCSECGPCVYGCPRGAKRNALATWVRDAAEAGARIVVHCTAERILARGGVVTGVEASALDPLTGQRHRVEIRCGAVVVSGGTVFSPTLLLRSGLGNHMVGRGVRLHPVTAALGVYDRPIEIWSGAAQTAMCSTFARVAGRHGFWIEAAPAHPGLAAMAVPWRSRREYAQLMSHLRRTAALIVLVRDRGSGMVRVTREGAPVVRYQLHPQDRQMLVRGLEEMAKIHLAAGAQEVYSLHTRPIYARRDEPDAAEKFSRAVQAEGILPNAVTLFSAHLMGGLPMGADSRAAAVDPSGRVYGVRNLYAADASVFPSAPAVNPQITIMALAYRIASRME
jgi:choline dehydrogenase-like flavoprotein